jgi:AcrR family transcriptional regulator
MVRDGQPSLNKIRTLILFRVDIQELNYLFTTLTFNTANEISLDELATRSGVAKNTIKRYIEYLEAAFLIRVVHRVDKTARRFHRANFFKVYLTNPSMRAALFAPVTATDEAMGALAETAVFAQWFHSGDASLRYARWQGGEVDLVRLNARQKPVEAVEVKWSDAYVKKPGDLRSLVSFCETNGLPDALATSRTQSGAATVRDVQLRFIPASLYCYTIGHMAVEGRAIPDAARVVDGMGLTGSFAVGPE